MTSADAARAILEDGFHDAEGSYGFATMWLKGVWVSDEPLSVNEGALGESCLEVTLPDDVDLDPFEIIEDLANYRVWCVPAKMLGLGQVRLLSEDELFSLMFPE